MLGLSSGMEVMPIAQSYLPKFKTVVKIARKLELSLRKVIFFFYHLIPSPFDQKYDPPPSSFFACDF